MSGALSYAKPRWRTWGRRLVPIAVAVVVLAAVYIALGPRTHTHRFVLNGKPGANAVVTFLDGRPPVSTNANGEVRFVLSAGDELWYQTAFPNGTRFSCKASGRGLTETYSSSRGTVITKTVDWVIWKQGSRSVELSGTKTIVDQFERGEITQRELIAQFETLSAELEREAADAGI
ncbi:hypothetical protein Pla123a_00850 [Posidoniimonas polymericola]|uniref:Uncharacterized protein n=1 Tax=Posidoniimonas polymericola TaxID=2528002 RepID=A0A5C5ZDN0_9BACT|nr:hypothetical protein [Posidoniimonas polymericola]TWT85278.1 hypothetical protein Pla123a_00850 [Posidoniimonas polymericola]